MQHVTDSPTLGSMEHFIRYYSVIVVIKWMTMQEPGEAARNLREASLPRSVRESSPRILQTRWCTLQSVYCIRLDVPTEYCTRSGNGRFLANIPSWGALQNIIFLTWSVFVGHFCGLLNPDTQTLTQTSRFLQRDEVSKTLGTHLYNEFCDA